MQTLSPRLSHWLRHYYLGPDHPGKLRLLNAFFKLTGLRLQVPYAEHGWITLDPRDGVQASILRYGFYEPEVWDCLAAIASREEIFWDIGSNIGGIGIRAALDSRIKEVHCFEPHPRIFEVLAANIARNSDRSLKAHQLALSDKSESRTLYSASEENCGASSLETRKANGRSFRVTCRTIDEVITNKIAPPPTLVKIDVEGWEMSVLRGGAGLFSTAPPRALVIEASVDRNGKLANDELRGFMQDHGYRIEHIRRSYDKVEEVENFLFVRSPSLKS